MRIVGGEFRGRRILAPEGDDVRPTSDRVRQALFDTLTHSHRDVLSGTRALDLFAGTGALGLEALSRGCRFCLFVDEGQGGRALLRRNVEAFGLTGRTKIWRRDATQLGRCTLPPFALAFADPPYGKGLGERAAAALIEGGWLEAGALLVLEERADALPTALDGFDALDRRDFGGTAVGLFRCGETQARAFL